MLKLSGPRGVQQHQPRLPSEKQLECVPGCKSMNDPIDFTLATDATGAECTLCLRGKMIQKELAAQESGGGWNRCRPAGEGRQAALVARAASASWAPALCRCCDPRQRPASSCRPRLVEQFEPLGLQVPRSCGHSNAITCSHQFV